MNLVEANPREWWNNTGAMRHVCSDRRLFNSYIEIKHVENLFIGNSAISTIKSQGNVVLKTIYGKDLALKYLFHVLEIRKNLTSTCSLLNKHDFRMC